jgi:hypothetical protein
MFGAGEVLLGRRVRRLLCVAWSSALCYREHLPTSLPWGPPRQRARHATNHCSKLALALPRVEVVGPLRRQIQLSSWTPLALVMGHAAKTDAVVKSLRRIHMRRCTGSHPLAARLLTYTHPLRECLALQYQLPTFSTPGLASDHATQRCILHSRWTSEVHSRRDKGLVPA